MTELLNKYEGVWCTECQSFPEPDESTGCMEDGCHCGHVVKWKKDRPDSWVECVIEVRRKR